MTSSETRPTPRFETCAVTAILFYFAVKLVFFAFRIGENIAPDEITWFGISKVFADSWLVPADSPASYQFGPVSRLPYLYFLLMGKLINVNIFGISDLIFLRLANAGLGLVTAVAGYRLIRLLTESAVARLLFLVFITNTLMFTFLFASVNYDNLTNCLALLSLYQLAAFFRFRTPARLLATLFFLLLGCLTKLAFLPFAALLLVSMSVHERREILRLPAELTAIFKPPAATKIILASSCLFLLGLNLELHGRNLIRHGRLNPGLEQIAGIEAAMQYRIFARDYIVSQFKEKKISYAEAVRMTWRIKHDGDRQGALYLLQQAAREQGETTPYRLGRLRYALPWFDLMSAKIFGVMGHLSLEKHGAALFPYYAVLAAGLLMLLRSGRLTDLHGLMPHLAFISAAYAIVLMQFVNYQTYSGSGVIVLALQGRYLFPVLPPIMILCAEYLAGRFARQWQNILAGSIAAAIFIAGEFPWFLANAGAEWFFPR